MALPPQLTAAAMGPGGAAEQIPQELEVLIEEALEPGILAQDEMMEVEAPAYNHTANLAEVLDSGALSQLSSDLRSSYSDDKESRDDWEQAIAKGLKLLGVNYEERSEPFLGASGVHHPMLSEAVTQFQAAAYKEMLPAGGPVKTQVLGAPNKVLEDQAQRVKDYMNFQITEIMDEYDPDLDQMLYYLPLTGSTFKKVYFDQAKKRAVSQFVPAEDLVVPYAATDLRTAERITHVVRMNSNELRKLQVAGVYRDIELSPSSDDSDMDSIRSTGDELQGIRPNYNDDVHTILECHVDMDIEGFEDLDALGQPTGVGLPYIVTIDEGSGEVLSVVRNWREDDPLKRKRDYFVHYRFLPGFGFYGFGLLHTIGGLSQAATSILRQLIDAGTLSNLPGGFKARGIRDRKDDEPIAPGEFRAIDVPGGSLRDAIIPLPYKEPSATLERLLGVIVDGGRRFAAVTDAKISDANANAPVGTTVALLEQGSKIISGIHKRLHYAQKQEFRILAEVFGENPVPYPYNIGGGVPAEIMAQDFDGRIDILPVSDPSIFSMAQRVTLAQTQLQLAQQAPQLHNQYEAFRRMYDALDVKNIDAILPVPQPPTPKDPAIENANAFRGVPMQAFPQQSHEQHITAHAQFLSSPMATANPQGYLLLQAHLQEHISLLARDQVSVFFQKAQQEALRIEGVMPQIDLVAVEAAIAEQIVEISKDVMGLIQPAQQEDPLVGIRQQELMNDSMELQRKIENDKMSFQIDQAKLQQSFDLARERIALQKEIADDRADVNLYRINSQTAMAANRSNR